MRAYLRVLLVSVLLATMSPVSQAAEEPLPHGLRGFSGRVRGVVVEKGEEGVWFRVGRVLEVWDNSKAENPDALAGRTVRVGPKWVRGDEGGEWHPMELHLAFIAGLNPGAEMNLEIQNVEDDGFQILELDGDAARHLRGQRDQHERERAENHERGRAEQRERERDLRPERGLEMEITIRVLQEQLHRVYQENAELRRRVHELEEQERR